MRVLIINNLSSGSAGGSIYKFMQQLISDGDEVVIRSTDGTTDLRTFLKDGKDFDLVVAYGGDGTVAMVLYEMRNTGVPILPYPAGTANLLTTNNIASPDDAASLAKMCRDMRTLDFDIAEIEAGGKVYGFNIIAGAGYDGVIMHEAKSGKKIFGSMAYVGAALANAIPPKSRMKITLGDGQVIESNGIGCMVMNFSKIKFDIAITHENTPRDGLLDVVVLRTQSALELLPVVGAAFLDIIGDYPDRGDCFDVYRATSVTVEADPPLPMQFDGEAYGIETPFTARVLPGAARLVLSEEGYNLFK